MAATNLETVRADIDNIINTSEFSTTITYSDKVTTYDDDNSINEVTPTDYSILVNFHPESNAELKVNEKLGTVTPGTAIVFFKYQYVIDTDTTIVVKKDHRITVDGTAYRITQLKPWTVGTGVAYYEGRVKREDLM